MDPEQVQQLCQQAVILIELVARCVNSLADQSADDDDNDRPSPRRLSKKTILPRDRAQIIPEVQYPLVDAAQYLDASVPTLRAWIKKKHLKASMTEKRRLVIEGSEILRKSGVTHS